MPTGRMNSPARTGGRTSPNLVEMVLETVLDRPANTKKGITNAADSIDDFPITCKKTTRYRSVNKKLCLIKQ